MFEDLVETVGVAGGFEPGDLARLFLHLDPESGADQEKTVELPFGRAFVDIAFGQPAVGLDLSRLQVEVADLRCAGDLGRKSIPDDHLEGEHDFVESLVEQWIRWQQAFKGCSPGRMGRARFLGGSCLIFDWLDLVGSRLGRW